MGEFRHNQMNGRGTLFFKNNTQYTGRFKDGKRQGKGLFRDQSGVYFEEEWEDNAQVMKREMKGTFHMDVRLNLQDAQRR